MSPYCARTGRIAGAHPFPEKGVADLSDEFSAHRPVLWDRDWRLRDPKNPTDGPYEALRPGRGDRVVHRYIYDGQRVAQRETYRNLGRDRSPTETTRFINTVPGGPSFFVDSDARLDVDLPDRYGRQMLRYRAREGNHWILKLPPEFPLDRFRNTGILHAPPLPPGPYFDYLPWYRHALEPDVLMGRRGILGLRNGLACDRGLWLHGRPYPVAVENWSLERAVGGALMVVGGVVVGITTGWTGGGLVVAGGLIIGGVGSITAGYAEASLHSPDAWWALSDRRTAQWVGIAGNTLFAFGTAMAATPILGAAAGMFPRTMLGLGIAGLYPLGREVVDIASDWSRMDAMERAGRVLPLVGGLAGGLVAGPAAARAYRLAGRAQRQALARELLRYARSEELRANAATAGFSKEQIAQLAARIERYAAEDSISYSLIVPRATDKGIKISLFGRPSRLLHELGHVLEDIADPGLLARDAAGRLTYGQIVGAERIAYIVQSGRFRRWSWNWLNAHMAAIHATTKLGYPAAAAGIGLTAWSAYTLYKLGKEVGFFRVMKDTLDYLLPDL